MSLLIKQSPALIGIIFLNCILQPGTFIFSEVILPRVNDGQILYYKFQTFIPYWIIYYNYKKFQSQYSYIDIIWHCVKDIDEEDSRGLSLNRVKVIQNSMKVSISNPFSIGKMGSGEKLWKDLLGIFFLKIYAKILEPKPKKNIKIQGVQQ